MTASSLRCRCNMTLLMDLERQRGDMITRYHSGLPFPSWVVEVTVEIVEVGTDTETAQLLAARHGVAALTAWDEV